MEEMSLFQCGHCGCVENTALSGGHIVFLHGSYDFEGIEERQGKRLCSACSPEKFKKSKESTGYGVWHGKFERVFLEKGAFSTNRVGKLEHIATGDDGYRKMALKIEAIV